MRMSNSFQTSIDDLAGIAASFNNSSEWSFRGITISAEQYSGNIDADLAALPAKDIAGNADPAASKGNQCHKSADGPARPSFFGRCLSASTCAATSYVNAEASMKPNYAQPSFESMSQFSTYIHTPATSVDEHGDVSPVQDDSVEMQQPSLYSRFPAYASGPTPLESWYNQHERHELIAYELSYHKRDSMAQKEFKESHGKEVQKLK
ncbi:3f341a1b-1a11-412a-9c7b-a3362d37ec56 [Sclerotinia trifoliorum]|uniref:3f341a1b-1a11-412a-9c7b-a3362d37ec56 n=1 Tax=Sclerotinia trifoliorum TaxID=28548 RepID=A0A8H2VR22_9HELO|nr:3f341a1b-1a11-412a-9c7b-a3362d37ec56 [Sclerotinia trifoliorum]